jgi:hypothetical protein
LPVFRIENTCPPLDDEPPVAASIAYPNRPVVSKAIAPSDRPVSGSLANSVIDEPSSASRTIRLSGVWQ